MKPYKILAGLALLVLCTTVPFLQRAYFVDDYYHVTMAKGLLAHPLRPYDFYSDDAGHHVIAWERGAAPRMVNPPLFHYYLAAILKVFGGRLRVLRASTLPLSIISVWCVYFLGKRFTARPGLAAALMALTPAYWLTSYSLLIDSGLMPLFLASLLVFFKALDRRKAGPAMLAGLLMGLTLLVKYSGVLVVAVALLWQLSARDRRRWLPGYAAYIVCCGVLLAWGFWNIAAYGRMHLLATLPRGVHGLSFLAWSGKLLVVSAFFSGGTIFVLGGYPLLAVTRRKVLAAVIAFVGLLTVIFVSSYGGFSWSQAAMFAVEAGGTAAFLLAAQHARQRFLLWWLVLGLAELTVMMPWTAARYFLIVLPPAVWLFIDAFDRERLSRWIIPFAEATALFGACLAYADYAQAGVIRKLEWALTANSPAFEKLAPRSSNKWYFLADTFDGAQPYIEPLGWESVFPNQNFSRGDLFLRARYRKSSWWAVPHPERFEWLARFVYDSRLPLRVMDVPASAGFYASCWGALPFTVTKDPLEEFDLYLVKK
jgi:hypothetical protein